jgi:ribosomal protein S18 acetylase RimI-like enzyme
MQTADVLAAFDDQMRRNVQGDGPAVRIERVGDVVRQSGAGWNAIVWSDLDEATADAAIAAQVAHFTALGQELEWKLYGHDRPADLWARLQAAGFVPDAPETLMAAEVAGLATTVTLPEGVALRRVTDPADLALLTRVHEQVYGEPGHELVDGVRALLVDQPDRVVVLVAMAGEEPVCAARLELPAGSDFAGLWGGSTVPAWRGRGVYRALVAARAGIAAERGYRYLQVDASADSRPILSRLGFAVLGTTTPYVLSPQTVQTVRG